MGDPIAEMAMGWAFICLKAALELPVWNVEPVLEFRNRAERADIGASLAVEGC